MHGEEIGAQVGRGFEIGEYMGEEAPGIRVAVVLVVILLGAGPRFGLEVVEDDNLVNAEYGKGAGDLAG